MLIFVMRLWIPESPRWLVTHGQGQAADAVVAQIEQRSGRVDGTPSRLPKVKMRARTHTPLIEVARTLLQTYPRRTLVGLSLMAAQAFFYNAIFFTYALILTDFYGVPAAGVGWYILPFAAGNFLGPLLLGRLFDTLGRKLMIGITYAVSGILLAGTGYLFSQGLLSAQSQTARLDDHLLLRLGGGELRLSDGERDLPARDPRARDRLLLRDRHRGRRRGRAVAVRHAHRHRVARERGGRLSSGRGR